jgi:hypothetical protein
LEVLELPLNTLGVPNRTVTQVTITASAAAIIGATTISLTPASAITLRAGNVLSFRAGSEAYRTQVVVLSDHSNISAATTVTIAPLSRAITSGATASFVNGLLPLTGIQTLDLNNQETQVDTTSFLSGPGSETALVRVNRSYSVSGVALAADEALESVIKPIGAFSGNMFNREIYAAATFSDGERIEGVAKIYALNFPANQNEVKKYSFTLAFQGRAFTWTRPYTAFV